MAALGKRSASCQAATVGRANPERIRRKMERMRLLVLGGTQFVGRHLVAEALRRGHEVSLFHRGRTNADLFPEAEHILGDRLEDVSALTGTWDAVVDVSAYVPRAVDMMMSQLAGRASTYQFVSTISVYEPEFTGLMEENAPRVPAPEPPTEEITPMTYGALKTACEDALDAWNGPVQIVRPGLIIGSHDATERYPYWPWRMQRGGDVLVPETRQPIQWVDARDLTGWMLDLLSTDATGPFNAVGPYDFTTLPDLVKATRDVVNPSANLVMVPEADLIAAELGGADLPFWFAGAGRAGIMQVNSDRAQAHGLRYRPVAESVHDTVTWWNETRGEAKPKNGLTPEREAELLARFA